MFAWTYYLLISHLMPKTHVDPMMSTCLAARFPTAMATMRKEYLGRSG